MKSMSRWLLAVLLGGSVALVVRYSIPSQPGGGPIQAKFIATTAGVQDPWESFPGTFGQVPPYSVAVHQVIEFEDVSTDLDPGYDGQGGGIPDQIESHVWKVEVNGQIISTTTLGQGEVLWSYTEDIPREFTIIETVDDGQGGDDPQDCCLNFSAVAVDKIQCYHDDAWHDVAGTLYVLSGTTVWFRAVKTPPVSFPWPAGKPVWSGSSGVSGTGTTKSVTFNGVSADPSDFKTVTAECGNAVTVNVIVYSLEGVTTPVDNFANRSQYFYGIAEHVNLSFTASPAVTAGQAGGLEWKLAVGVGTVSANSAGTGVFDAGALGGTVCLKLEVLSGPSEGLGPQYARYVVAPWGAYMQQMPNTLVWHINGYYSVGWRGHAYLMPKDVSFTNIDFREGECWSTATGYLAVYHHVQHVPTTNWLDVLDGNATDGCRVDSYDQCEMFNPDPNWADGDFNWPIPWQYRVDGGSPVQIIIANHHATSDSNGTAVLEKRGLSKSTVPSDPSSGYTP